MTSDELRKALIEKNGYAACYLAGPMSGKDDHNFPAFKSAAAFLRRLGWHVTNPAETDDGDITKPRSYYMQIDITNVTDTQCLFVLPGWRDSKGAALEVLVACECDIPVYQLYGKEGVWILSTLPIARQTLEYERGGEGSRQFDTGSQRDSRKGKGRFDLLPPRALARLARHFEQGAEKYGDRNWEKGQPQSVFFDSANRHLSQFAAGKVEEDHLTAALWNIMAMVDQEERWREGKLPADLMDFPI